VTWFWVKNEGNNRVVYKEVVVCDGEGTQAAIHAFADDANELLMPKANLTTLKIINFNFLKFKYKKIKLYIYIIRIKFENKIK
jgi:hypothetical protein